MEDDSHMDLGLTTWTWLDVQKLLTKFIKNAQDSLHETSLLLYEKGKILCADILTSLNEVQTLSTENVVAFLLILIIFYKCICVLKRSVKKRIKLRQVDDSGDQTFKSNDGLAANWSVFDLAKTAYEPGHAQAAINVIEKLHYDVNSVIPSNGLTLFLCACLSGQKGLIKYMLSKGADVTRTTKAGDTALYLATFGVLSTTKPDVSILEELVQSGCDVNAANLAGYTPLHRAASNGNLDVIQTLLKYGADPYKASCSGIFPIDSAINAGNLDAAELLKVHIPNPYVWDVVEPHTPPHIKLGLQSPQRKHLMESTRRIFSPRIM